MLASKPFNLVQAGWHDSQTTQTGVMETEQVAFCKQSSANYPGVSEHRWLFRATAGTRETESACTKAPMSLDFHLHVQRLLVPFS